MEHVWAVTFRKSTIGRLESDRSVPGGGPLVMSSWRSCELREWAHQRGLSGAPRAVRAIEDGGRGPAPGRCRFSSHHPSRRAMLSIPALTKAIGSSGFSQPNVGGCANARVRRLWSSTPGRPSGTAPRDTRPIFIAGRVGIPRTVNLLSGSAQQELRWRYLSDLSAASPLIASDLL